uniref:Uncharacterized protein n=1 Tax=Oryza rufipogon TaxID=4529 RepID=A0A0E0P824_ORYRU
MVGGDRLCRWEGSRVLELQGWWRAVGRISSQGKGRHQIWLKGRGKLTGAIKEGDDTHMEEEHKKGGKRRCVWMRVLPRC